MIKLSQRKHHKPGKQHFFCFSHKRVLFLASKVRYMHNPNHSCDNVAYTAPSLTQLSFFTTHKRVTSDNY